MITFFSTKNIFIIFLNTLIFIGYAKYSPIPAYMIYVITTALLYAYYMSTQTKIRINIYLAGWMMFYLSVYGIYFIGDMASSSAWREFKYPLYFSFFLGSMTLVYGLDDKNCSFSRKIIAFSGIIGVIMLGIDYFDPGYFMQDLNTEDITGGRAAALYGNANIAAAIMNLVLILSIDIIPKKYRLLFIIIIFFGIFFTMSRSNIMIFLALCIVFFAQKKINLLGLMTTIISIFIFATWLSLGGFDYLSENYDLKVSQDMQNRVAFFKADKNTDMSNTNERLEVLKAALNLFMDHPITGVGIGATTGGRTFLWPHNVGPHNTFAANWAEFGLLGVLFIPLLLFSSTYLIFIGNNKELKQLAVLFIIFFVTQSFFSHNMLEQPYQLAAAVMLSVLGVKNRYTTSESESENVSNTKEIKDERNQ